MSVEMGIFNKRLLRVFGFGEVLVSDRYLNQYAMRHPNALLLTISSQFTPVCINSLALVIIYVMFSLPQFELRLSYLILFYTKNYCLPLKYMYEKALQTLIKSSYQKGFKTTEGRNHENN